MLLYKILEVRICGEFDEKMNEFKSIYFFTPLHSLFKVIKIGQSLLVIIFFQSQHKQYEFFKPPLKYQPDSHT